LMGWARMQVALLLDQCHQTNRYCLGNEPTLPKQCRPKADQTLRVVGNDQNTNSPPPQQQHFEHVDMQMVHLVHSVSDDTLLQARNGNGDLTYCGYCASCGDGRLQQMAMADQ